MSGLVDWSKYYGKQFARLYGWLPASKDFKKKYKIKKIKYLTLCDVTALDIFMLESEGILIRDKDKFLQDVIICEKNESSIPAIFEAVKPPLKEAIIEGKIEKLLLFEDDNDTKDVDIYTDVKSKKIREKLRLKENAIQLKEHFPFDIINFDPFGNIYRRQSELFRGFQKIFEFQRSKQQFLLFLTSSVEIGDCALLFEEDFRKNIVDYEEIRILVESDSNLRNYNTLHDTVKASIGISKTIINKLAIQYKWQSFHHGIYVYQNAHGRFQISSVVEFTQNSSLEEDWYLKDVVNILKNMPKTITFEEAENNQLIKDSLEFIEDYRSKIQKEFI